MQMPVQRRGLRWILISGLINRTYLRSFATCCASTMSLMSPLKEKMYRIYLTLAQFNLIERVSTDSIFNSVISSIVTTKQRQNDQRDQKRSDEMNRRAETGNCMCVAGWQL